MDEQLTFRPIRPGEETALVDLVLRVFDETVAPLYSQEGVSEFRRYVTPEALLARSYSNHFVLVTAAGNSLVGAIEVRDCNHVCLLFVDVAHQRRGIARELLTGVLDLCRTRRPDLREITVNSSPNSVEVYRRLGFTSLGPEMTINGIRFTPMTLRVRE